jgi:NMD protein affecting ribosome stability and mRNA decay
MVRTLEGKRPEYFEAILQLRDCDKEIIDFAEKEITRLKLTVSDVIDLKNGIDYYLSDNNLTKQLGKKLQERYGGEYLITATLHTKKKGKELFRLTILFRQAKIKKGNIVKYQGEEYEVKAMSKEIFLQNTKTGKKVRVKYKNMNQIKASATSLTS